MSYHIASVSFGKDSIAMLLEIIKRGMPLNEVIFYDTGMEFEAIYRMRDKALPLLKAMGIVYTELKPEYKFTYKMFDKPVQERSGGTHNGYSWCGGRCRWGTTDKLQALDKYARSKNAKVYVGIAADESHRLERERKPYKVFPMIEWGMTEAAALQLCYDNGFDWLQDSIRLYDILDRVSCWCCCNKNLKELKNIYIYLPSIWERLKELQSRTARPMKGFYKGMPKGVFELEQRFKIEIEEEQQKEVNRMQKSKLKPLTLKTAKEIIKREFGVSAAQLKRETSYKSPTYIYTMDLGNYIISVSNDPFKCSGRIYLIIQHKWALGGIKRYFSAETLEEDDDFTEHQRSLDKAEDLEELVCEIGLEGCKRVLEKVADGR